VDRGSVVELSERTQALGERLHRQAAGTVLAEMRAHLARVRAALEGARTGTALRSRLYRVTAEAATLTGWTAWLVGCPAEAAALYGQAEAMAREAGDVEAHALALTARSAMHSGVPSGGQEGDSGQAIRLLAVAQAETDSALVSPHLRTWIAASTAQEHALLGDTLAMRRCLDRAASIYPGRPGPGFFSDWDEALLRSYAGVSHTMAGEAREAIAVLDPLLAAVDVSQTQWAVASEADLGAAWAAAGELERASEILSRAVEHARYLQLEVDARRAAGYRRRLLPHGPRAPLAVRRLDERLRQLPS
jgi:tetratricopeptide (TPR) repeat protein